MALEPTYTVTEVATHLSRHRDYVWKLIRSGQILAVDISGGGKQARYRITESALKAFLAKRTKGATS